MQNINIKAIIPAVIAISSHICNSIHPDKAPVPILTSGVSIISNILITDIRHMIKAKILANAEYRKAREIYWLTGTFMCALRIFVCRLLKLSACL